MFADVTPEMTIAPEEIFGPVVSVMTYENEDDAVRLANASDFGLSGVVFRATPSMLMPLAGACSRGMSVSTV